jgi:DNA-binding NtrC family response regulator
MPEGLNPVDPILLIDDEEGFLHSASLALRSSGYNHVVCVCDSRKAEALLKKPASLVLLDVMMPHLNGPELLPRLLSLQPGLPVVMLTAVSDTATVVECVRAGAADYLTKPVDKARLLTTVRAALESGELKRENDRLRQGLLTQGLAHPRAFECILTRSLAMRGIFTYIEAVAPSTLPVLITGETGTGKELVARALHDCSGRRGPFVAVNAAGLDDALFSDTLFGHARGAFTGAGDKREGLVASAAGGTLFLDEIGDLKLESQVKLLRLLESRAYYPACSDEPRTTDARVVVATNLSLDELQDPARFRADLFYRLRSHHLALPALRERPEDLALLAGHFLEMACLELKKKLPHVPAQLEELLCAHPFPGNVRELKSMVFEALSRHGSKTLSLEPFKETILKKKTPKAAQVPLATLEFAPILPTLKQAEDALVQEALRRAKGNQSIAAHSLGLTRSALNKRLNRQ